MGVGESVEAAPPRLRKRGFLESQGASQKKINHKGTPSKATMPEEGGLCHRKRAAKGRTCQGCARGCRLGGVIDPVFLLNAYAKGIFPMGMPEGDLGWFSPDPRGVLPLEDFHVPHGLARALKKGTFEVRVNTVFGEVMRACAQREETWIDAEILASYEELHRLGFAHSVEAWREGRLVGGLYGVVLGGVFFGESMFHRETDASKVALHALVERLRLRGFVLLDIQWVTPHLATFGAVEIPRSVYLRRLRTALRLDCAFA